MLSPGQQHYRIPPGQQQLRFRRRAIDFHFERPGIQDRERSGVASIPLADELAESSVPLKSRMCVLVSLTAGSMICGPAGIHRVDWSRTGQALPFTVAWPCHGTPTPYFDPITSFEPFCSALSTLAAAAESSGKSGLRMEFSKYSATLENDCAARWTN